MLGVHATNQIDRRKTDLALVKIECIWVEINIHNKRIILGTFYRPPNSTARTLSCIEDSVNLEFDSNIKDIHVTVNFNLDTLNQASNRRLCDICQKVSEFGQEIPQSHIAD